jgi:hypothetical protein
MKKIAGVFLISLMTMTVASEANAVVCARGVYRARCAGPHGAAVVRRPVAPAAVVPGRDVPG